MAQQRSNIITVRVSNTGFASIEKLAVEYGVSRSLVARAMLAAANNHPREVRTAIEGLTAS